MGLFDTVRIEMPLDDAHIVGAVYQTKSLGNLMENYTVKADGTLHKTENTYEWVNEEGRGLFGGFSKLLSTVEVPQMYYTGELAVHMATEDRISEGGRCGWLEYAFLFKDGAMHSWLCKSHTQAS